MLQFITILSEAYTRIRYDDGHAKALAFDSLLGDMIRRRLLSIRWVTPAVHEQALELFRRYSDHKFSIVDCARRLTANNSRSRNNSRRSSGFASK